MNKFDRSKTLLLTLMALCLIVLGGCYASTPTIESSDSNLFSKLSACFQFPFKITKFTLTARTSS